ALALACGHRREEPCPGPPQRLLHLLCRAHRVEPHASRQTRGGSRRGNPPPSPVHPDVANLADATPPALWQAHACRHTPGAQDDLSRTMEQHPEEAVLPAPGSQLVITRALIEPTEQRQERLVRSTSRLPAGRPVARPRVRLLQRGPRRA